MLNDSTLGFHNFPPSLKIVKCFIPLGDSFEVFSYEALIFRAVHSAIIMSQLLSDRNRYAAWLSRRHIRKPVSTTHAT